MTHHSKKLLYKFHRSQKGQALFLTLILVLAAGLLLVPMAGIIATGAQSALPYKTKTDEIYAADAGIQDARWKIKYDQLPANYSEFDYSSSWNSTLPEQINHKTVNVSLKNAWIPRGYDYPIDAPTKYQAQIVLNGQPALGHAPKVIVTSMPTGNTSLEIKIQYYPSQGEIFNMKTLGIWLPPGYSYVSSNITDYPFGFSKNPYAGGQSVTWDCNNYPFAGDAVHHIAPFSGVKPNDRPQCATIQITFFSSLTGAPDVIAWLDTNLDLTYGVYPSPPATCTWSDNTKIFEITSSAGGTRIEAYTSKNEVRPFGAAVGGDYYATGNALLGGSYGADNIHKDLYLSTTAQVPTGNENNPGIPADATIKAAYLYWTGWIDDIDYNDHTQELQPFTDSCVNFNNWEWDSSKKWTVYNNQFRCQGNGNDSQRTLIIHPLDLSDAASATISWKQSKGGTLGSNDGLKYYFSGDGVNWSEEEWAFRGNGTPASPLTVDIPSDYLTNTFYVKYYFYVSSTSSSKYVYLDDITVKKESSLTYPEHPTPKDITRLVEKTAKVNKVRFCTAPVTADTYQTLDPDQFDFGNWGGTWYYTCTADVTNLVKSMISAHQLQPNGAGAYTFGHYYTNTDSSADDYYRNPYLPSSFYFSFNDVPAYRTNYPLGSPPDPYSDGRNPAHAGWSLVIIYSSPSTLGHQLYLYDIKTPGFNFFFGFSSSTHYDRDAYPIPSSYDNPDFDRDGQPGGIISGFIVPEPVEGDVYAGRLTCFVGEGDDCYQNEFLRISRFNSPATKKQFNNPWNSTWAGDGGHIVVPGIDIDTFNIEWAWDILRPGDSAVRIDIPTAGSKGYTMSYMILSFRSRTSTGGLISYLIH